MNYNKQIINEICHITGQVYKSFTAETNYFYQSSMRKVESGFHVQWKDDKVIGLRFIDTTLPDELLPLIKELTNCTYLEFVKYEEKIIPEWVTELSQISSISFRFWRRPIPEWISDMYLLISLQISNYINVSLPMGIKGLQLQNLILSNNIGILPEWIQEIQSLKSLDIRGNNLNILPEWLFDVTQLENLRIGSNNIEIIPPEIKNLRHLKELYIQHNNIKIIPEEIGELTSLSLLNCKKNFLTCLPKSITKLTTLRNLNISNNEFVILPEGIRKLTQLNELDISNNNVTEIPDWIQEIVGLKALDLRQNPIEVLTDKLGYLPELSKLDLRRLQLKSIPRSLVKPNLPFVFTKSTINYYSGINLYNAKLSDMPISLFEQPYHIIFNFYQEDSVQLGETKVIFIGDGDVGKSTLIEKLITGSCEENKLPTNGIFIKNWPIEIDQKPVMLRIWDFGGQEIMHAMHRCFLTDRTVYVVVVECRNDTYLDRYANDWIENVRTFAPECPIVLVLNKIDTNQLVGVNESALYEKHPTLKAILKTSPTKNDYIEKGELLGDSIDALTTMIKQIVKKSGWYTAAFNKKWFQIKRQLETMADNYIDINKYTSICKKAGVLDSKIQQDLLRWFKDLGVAYYYESKDYSGVLKLIQVLNPEWLTNGIYRMILCLPENKGILPHKLITDIMSKGNNSDICPNITYTSLEVEYILQVMRHFGISLNIGNGELIPLRLPKTLAPTASLFNKNGALHLTWDSAYMPSNVIHRLMIRLINQLDINCMWRNGARFFDHKYKCEALVQADDRQISLYVNSKSNGEKRIYLEIVRNQILMILDELNIYVTENLHYKLYDKIGKIGYEDVLQQYIDGIDKIYLSDIKSYISPEKLLSLVYSGETIERERSIMAQFTDLNGNININIGGNQEIHRQRQEYKQVIQTLPNNISYEEEQNIIALIKELIGSGELKGKDERELVTILQTAEDGNKSIWSKFKSFLETGANFSTIMQAAAAAVPPLYSILQGLIK